MADDWDGLDPGFFNAMQGLFGACGLSLTSGYRTHDEQADLYRRKPNLAAPPGRSNHETGMAADIAGDLDCAHARAAEFGLHFPMDYEPWHIEPLDMDRTNTVDPPPPDSPEANLQSIAEIVFNGKVPSRAYQGPVDKAAKPAATPDPSKNPPGKVATLSGGGTMGGTEPAAAPPPTQSATPQTGAVTSGASMSTTDIARAYQAAGFSGEELVTMVAISLGESGGNPAARNLNASEDSRGLSQVNTYAHPQYNAEQLYDPLYNAQAAFEISGGGKNFGPWTVYTRGAYQQYMDEARAAVAAIGSATTTPTSTEDAPAEDAPAESDLLGAGSFDTLDTPGGGYGVGERNKIDTAGGKEGLF